MSYFFESFFLTAKTMSSGEILSIQLAGIYRLPILASSKTSLAIFVICIAIPRSIANSFAFLFSHFKASHIINPTVPAT